MDFEKYLLKEMLILIPVLYIIGMILKTTPKVRDWLIPWILLVIGVVFAVLVGMGAEMSIVDAVLQGILVTGVTVFANQLIIQTKYKEG